MECLSWAVSSSAECEVTIVVTTRGRETTENVHAALGPLTKWKKIYIRARTNYENFSRHSCTRTGTNANKANLFLHSALSFVIPRLTISEKFFLILSSFPLLLSLVFICRFLQPMGFARITPFFRVGTLSSYNSYRLAVSYL